ncbi:hypothetical protein NDU88_006101 [Pleurodeles waltl]|uniref:Uncharacterized protein n=1 Tax=Pleurodeles waltl TaxID=8319 RepID=A0AAV7PPQ0_PLEWA|nr:hypothetical protein NDU88_006101 [Pleurodeles waltl]
MEGRVLVLHFGQNRPGAGIGQEGRVRLEHRLKSRKVRGGDAGGRDGTREDLLEDADGPLDVNRAVCERVLEHSWDCEEED